MIEQETFLRAINEWWRVFCEDNTGSVWWFAGQLEKLFPEFKFAHKKPSQRGMGNDFGSWYIIQKLY